MHPACPNKKQNHLQNSFLRRAQFWVRKTFSKPASLKRASLVALLASRGLLAPDAWKCKRAQVSLKATIDVPMLGTIIEQNGDGLLEDSHMPVGWPLHIDGALYSSICNPPRTRRHVKRIRHEKKFSRNKSQRTPMVSQRSVEPKIHGTEDRIHTAATLG